MTITSVTPLSPSLFLFLSPPYSLRLSSNGYLLSTCVRRLREEEKKMGYDIFFLFVRHLKRYNLDLAMKPSEREHPRRFFFKRHPVS